MCPRLYAVAHFAKHTGLKPHEIAGEDKVNDLPFTIIQRLMPDAHAGQHRIELGGVGPLHEDCRAGVDAKLTDLEFLHELKLFPCHGDKGVLFVKRTIAAIDTHEKIPNSYVIV